jgi:nicotinate-nucleotide pyrophosphorylase (carboxylating)
VQPDAIKEALKILKEKGLRNSVIVEASGGISQSNLEAYAKTGVDVISMGSLIHKSSWIDVSLEMIDISRDISS